MCRSRPFGHQCWGPACRFLHHAPSSPHWTRHPALLPSSPPRWPAWHTPVSIKVDGILSHQLIPGLKLRCSHWPPCCWPVSTRGKTPSAPAWSLSSRSAWWPRSPSPSCWCSGLLPGSTAGTRSSVEHQDDFPVFLQQLEERLELLQNFPDLLGRGQPRLAIHMVVALIILLG